MESMVSTADMAEALNVFEIVTYKAAREIPPGHLLYELARAEQSANNIKRRSQVDTACSKTNK